MFELAGDSRRLVSDKLLAEPPVASDVSISTAQRQRQAAAALIDHSNEDILAWLKLARSARSIEPHPEQRSGNAHLSPSQIHALFALKDCPDDTLLACLELARLFGLYSYSTVHCR